MSELTATDRIWLPLSLREAVKDLPEDKRLIVAAWHARGSDAIGSYQQRVAELGERLVAMEAVVTAAVDFTDAWERDDEHGMAAAGQRLRDAARGAVAELDGGEGRP